MNLDHARRVLAHQENQQLINAERRAALDVIKSGSGKVFHTKAHARMKNEKYYTPAWVTRCLLRRVDLYGSIWEPAAGNGQIVTALNATRLPDEGTIWASDLEPDSPAQCAIEQRNFLTITDSPAAHIVTNPPFGTGGRLAFQFCHHALRLTQRHVGKVAMLLRDDFDSAKGRRSLFRDHPAFDRKIVITDRIRWTNLPQKAKAGPSGSHAWFVWDWSKDPTVEPIVQYESADVDLKNPEEWMK